MNYPVLHQIVLRLFLHLANSVGIMFNRKKNNLESILHRKLTNLHSYQYTTSCYSKHTPWSWCS